MSLWGEVLKEQRKISMSVIKDDEPPFWCDGCWFLIGSGGIICELTDTDLYTKSDGGKPIKSTCTVYDHTKWLLEHI